MLILRPPSAVHRRTRELYWKNQMLSLLEISMDWWAFGKPMTLEIGSMAWQPNSLVDFTQERTLRRADPMTRAQVHVDELRRAPRHRLEGVAPVREVDLLRVRVLGDMLGVEKPMI